MLHQLVHLGISPAEKAIRTAAILLAINYILVRGAFMSPRFGKAIQGGPTVVAKNGKADRKALRRLAVTREELSPDCVVREWSSRTRSS